MQIKKKVLILGGSSDIGISVINEYLLNDYLVFAHYNSNIKNFNSNRVKWIRCNFKNETSFNAFFSKIKHNNFSSIINLVGYIDNKTLEKSNLNNILDSIKINFIYPSLITNYFSKKMVKNNFGRILHCSSIGVKFGGGLNTYSYSLSKHLLEFIPSYYKKIIKNNVFYNTLRIGVTKTKIHNKIKNKIQKKRIKMIPIGRMANTKEIAEYIFYINSEKNSFISNQILSISGGE